MSRQRRATIAQETLAILQNGSYQASDSHTISIADALATSCQNTLLYEPEDYSELLSKAEASTKVAATSINVSNRTTLAAARSLVERFPNIACLNFASAKNPGGGFLGGSQAQEESLARASGLYAALQTQPAFYDYHRRLRTALYSDHVIFSPAVPVFRDDDDRLIAAPWQTAFLTAAAPNAGAVQQNEPQQRNRVAPTLEQRARMVLAVAATHGCAALVLGAWGCGVFRNDPTTVAVIFARILAEPPFAQRFEHVEFAVLDNSADQNTFRAFQKAF